MKIRLVLMSIMTLAILVLGSSLAQAALATRPHLRPNW
jgi:hypothetical protein